ncbi:hypothetical protein ABT224_33410 [Streptomyces sp. NPDC001584]|uniref:hypothetical protein n=1 Tax=Streptomyces sp. NPDC001584 TaxID=3154521 RepID=UPI0033243D3C
MTQKPRRSSKAVQAREAARAKAARFRELEDQRLRLAESAILIQEEIDDFDEETERRVAKLREERNGQLVEKRQRLDALVVEMLDTEIPAQEAAERLGMSVNQVRTAKRSFESTVAAFAEDPADPLYVLPVAAGASAEAALGEDTATPVPTPAEVDPAVVASPAVGVPESYDFPAPGATAMVPAQDGSPENLQAATLPPGSAG